MKHDALGAHARDEIGISVDGDARPIQAALSSACSFVVGAGLPLVVALLGFVRKVGSQATVDARNAYHRLKATCQLLIAGGNAA